MIVNNCPCGKEPTRWFDPELSGFDSMLSIEKIECECGKYVVYGGDEESVADWNAGKFD
jgi:hypothetical protein